MGLQQRMGTGARGTARRGANRCTDPCVARQDLKADVFEGARFGGRPFFNRGTFVESARFIMKKVIFARLREDCSLGREGIERKARSAHKRATASTPFRIAEQSFRK